MNRFFKLILCFIIALPLSGCRKALQDEKLVYQNSFETNDLSQTSGLIIHAYNGSKMAGNYNKAGFKVDLESLAKHDYLKISFDLYIHDNWDGNNSGNKEVATGPDIWSMLADGEYIINTTFSNTVCNVIYCLQQSYPNNYPWQNDPGSGDANISLPGMCAAGGITKLYHIEKLIKHDKGRAFVEFKDLLQQSNVSDQKCDESWSLDNLMISILNSN